MKRFTKSKKVLFGLAASLVLAMAIGSFALGETQTPANTQAAANEGTGDFVVEGGSYGEDADYHFETETDPQSGSERRTLYIHPQNDQTEITISNEGTTTDCIEVAPAEGKNIADNVKIKLAGVNIDRSGRTEIISPLEIARNATFNVNILLADNSNNILTASADIGCAGLDKGDDKTTETEIASLGTLTIGVPSDSTKGNGTLKATGGLGASGIGGSTEDNGRNIKITGGEIKAYGGVGGAGIGSGVPTISEGAAGSNITIIGGKVEAYGGKSDVSPDRSNILGGAGIGGACSVNGEIIKIKGGEVTAIGGAGAAGIGGGAVGSGKNIEITGGVVTATGGYIEIGDAKGAGAGIGGGAAEPDEPDTGYAINNKLDGDAVVFAASGDDSIKDALQGFEDTAGKSLITKGVAFTGVGTDFDDGGRATAVDYKAGKMYGNSITVTGDVKIPADFTIASNAALTIGKNASGKEATLSMEEGKKLTVEGSLINEGVIDIPAENLICNGNGKITTLLNYDPQGGSIKTNDDNYITYQDANGTKKYENLPEATKEGYDLEGWYTKEKGQGTKIETTDDVLLNQHTLYANWTTEPTPTPPTPTPPGPEPQPTPPGPQPGPEPTPTPEPTPDPSVNPDGSDSSGSGSSSKTSDPFMGGAALALLGVATTGAILTRKFR